MVKQILFILFSVLSVFSNAQNYKPKTITDNKKEFVYTDTGGVTDSYIKHFGSHFGVPVLTATDNTTIKPEDLQGKTVVYNFWFVACRPCVAEIPALNKLYEKYHSDSVVFIAISFDNEKKINGFLQKREFKFQHVSLQQEEISKIKKVAFYPFTAIVNKESQLSFAIFGRPMGKNPEEEIFILLDAQLQKILAN